MGPHTGFYFPMQKRPKIAPSRSSALNAPVIDASGVLRRAQLLGEQLDRRRRRGGVLRRQSQMPVGPCASAADVARAREIRLFRAFARADRVEHRALDQVDAVAVARADPDVAAVRVRRNAGEIGLVVNDDPR
jgi:hypothetical protein